MAVSIQEKQAMLEDFLLDEVIALIRGKQEQKGLKASGRSARELTADASIVLDGAVIRGQVVDPTGSFRAQEFGMSPEEAQAVPDLMRRLYQWLEFKKYGLNWADERERQRLAAILYHKIRKSGTYTYRKKKPTGVVSEVINQVSIDKLKDIILTTQNVVDIKSELLKGLK